jgi:general secretion pathway protein G
VPPHRRLGYPPAWAKPRPKGFTLIELLLALAVAAVLMSLAHSSYRTYILRAQIAQAIADIQALDAKIEVYFLNTRGYPDTLAAVGGAPQDPWGNAYAYLNIQTVKGVGKVRKDKNLVPLNSDYDLYSKGPDGRSQTPLTAKASRDDIVRAGNGNFVGVAEDY